MHRRRADPECNRDRDGEQELHAQHETRRQLAHALLVFETLRVLPLEARVSCPFGRAERLELPHAAQVVGHYRGELPFFPALLLGSHEDVSAARAHGGEGEQTPESEHGAKYRVEPEEHGERSDEDRQRLEYVDHETVDAASEAGGIVKDTRDELAHVARLVKDERLSHQVGEERCPEAVQHTVAESVQEKRLGKIRPGGSESKHYEQQAENKEAARGRGCDP